MTKGQRVMAVAMIYPEPAKLKRKGGSVKITEQNFSESMLSHARTVLAQTPEAAKQVLAAGLPLAESMTAQRIATWSSA